MPGLMLFLQSAGSESSLVRSLPWQLALLVLLFAAFFLKRILPRASRSAAPQSQGDRLKARRGEPILERLRARGLAAGD